MLTFPDTYNSIQHIYYRFNELKKYKDYIQRYERMIREELEDYNKFLNDSDFFLELGPKFDFESNHSHNLSVEFPNTQRKSAFVSLISYFENSMNELCEIYEYHNKLPVNFKDMSGQGVERAKLYLIKIVGLDFPTSKGWNDIKILLRIRNNIVHSYSEVYTENKQLVSDIKSFQYLTLYKLQTKSLLQIEEKFLYSVIEIFESFYKELLESVKKQGTI